MKKLLMILTIVSLVGAAAAAQATLTIYADDTRTPLLRNIGVEFTAATGVAVEVVEFPWNDLRPNFITATQAGEGPDIIIWAHDAVGELVASGLIEPLDLGARAADFSSAALEAFTVGGTVYGMPYGTENLSLIYNKEFVPQPPRTWDEVLAICRALYDPDAPMYGLAFQNTAGNFYQFFPMLSAAGGYIFGLNPDGTYNPCDVGLYTPGAIFGATLYQDMLEEGILPNGVDWDTLNALVAGKNVAMVITGPWLLNAIQDAGWDYGITRIPVIQGADGVYHQPKVFTGVQGFMLSAFSENKTIAMDFLLNYVATTDVMAEIALAGNRVPTFIPAIGSAPADLAAFAEQAAFGLPMPSIPQMASIWQEGGNALDLINNGTDPALALAQAQTLILQAVGCEE